MGYINIMFVLGTLYMISEAWANQVGFVDYPGGPLQFGDVSDGYPLDYMGNVVFLLAYWLADGLLLWRCLVIWQGSRLRPLVIVPCLLYLCNIALSIVLLAQINHPTDLAPSFDASTPYFIVSLTVTLFISVLIVARILLQRRWILNTSGGLGDHGKQYISIAAMIIESAALYSAFNLSFLIPFIINSPLIVMFLPLLAIVQIIAPLLIIYRVAQGHSWNSEVSKAAYSEEIQFTSASTALSFRATEDATPMDSQQKNKPTVTFAGSKDGW